MIFPSINQFIVIKRFSKVSISFSIILNLSIAQGSLVTWHLVFIAASACTTTIKSLEPCSLNAKFQHFIPRFNKISLLCNFADFTQRGDRELKGGPKTRWLYRKPYKSFVMIAALFWADENFQIKKINLNPKIWKQS